jgi:putative inorganic carbon (hco3(-)) transporter
MEPSLSLVAIPDSIRTRRSLHAPAAAIAAFLILTLAAIVAARVSPVAFATIGVALAVLVGLAAFRWPRTAIVLVVLSPILDRYVVAGVLPSDAGPVSHFLSEAFLLTVTLAVAARAARDGTLLPALRHPTTVLLAAFCVIALASAALNAVPPHVAALGVVFTLDAAVLFVLARAVTWSTREAALALGAFITIVIAAAVLVVAQGLLTPTLFGFDLVTGRFGEVYRLAAFVGDPNVVGTFITVAAPFAVLAAANATARRPAVMAGVVAYVMLVALWLTFSRGSWLALAVSTAVALVWFGYRTAAIAAAVIAVSFATAIVMPRDLILEEGGGRPDLIGSTLGRVGAVPEGRDLRSLFVQNAVPIIADHPLLGVGPGRYGGAVADLVETPVYAEYGTDELFTVPTQRTVDNFWLHLVVELGAIGTAIFIAAAAVPWVQVVQAARRAIGARRVMLGGIATAAVAIGASSLTTMLLEANSVGFLFWFVLGVGSVLSTRGEAPGDVRLDEDLAG